MPVKPSKGMVVPFDLCLDPPLQVAPQGQGTTADGINGLLDPAVAGVAARLNELRVGNQPKSCSARPYSPKGLLDGRRPEW